MNSEILKDEFKNIFTYEERAKHFYDHYIDQIDDEEIKNILISIRDDEIMHMEVAKKLIEMVS